MQNARMQKKKRLQEQGHNDSLAALTPGRIENKVRDSLSDKKRLLQLAIFSLIQSMRNNPEKYSTLVYHNNDNQNSLSSISKDNNNRNPSYASRQVTLPPPPYDGYIIEHYKDTMLEAR